MKHSSLFTLLSSAAVVVTAEQTQTQPHLVFMMADQLRWNINGYAGNQQNLTVNLDQLASEGG